MTLATRCLTITQSNLDNDYLYLKEVLDIFPEDVMGGSDERLAANRTVRIHWNDEFTDTDIDQTKKIFRKRSWVRRFFDANRIQAGDQVLLEQIEPHVFRISKVESLVSEDG